MYICELPPANTEMVLPVDVTRSREMSGEALENPGCSHLGVKRRPAPSRGFGKEAEDEVAKAHMIHQHLCLLPQLGAGLGGHGDTRLHSVQPAQRFHENLFLRLCLPTDLDEGRMQGDSKRRSFQIPVTCNPWPRWLFKLTVTIIHLDKVKVIPELILRFAAVNRVQDHDGGVTKHWSGCAVAVWNFGMIKNQHSYKKGGYKTILNAFETHPHLHPETWESSPFTFTSMLHVPKTS